jgi:hypothetical protein
MTYSLNTSDDFMFGQFNSDTTYTNYRSHYLLGNGSTVSASSVQSTGYAGVLSGAVPMSAAGQTSTFGSSIIDILDYANTNKYKTVRALSGDDWNGAGSMVLISGLWMNTAAVSSITLNLPAGYSTTFTSGSKFALYGVK